MMANGNANIIEFDDSTGGFINGSPAILACSCSKTLLHRCPRLMAVTHSASWESTQARIVLAWQEFLTRTERGILQMVNWIPMTAARILSRSFHRCVHHRIYRSWDGNYRECPLQLLRCQAYSGPA